MEAMAAARYNEYWFLWLFAPFVVMLAATFRHRRWDVIIGIGVSLATTYTLSNLAVQEKWRIRNEIAVTPEEVAYATADGANLVFTFLLIAPVEAIVLTWLWGLVGWRCWPSITRAIKGRA